MRNYKLILESQILKWIGINHELPIQIDITNLCNLKCIHCYHPDHNNSGSLSLDNWYQILGEYFQLISEFNFKPKVIICGGEPLISPMLVPILKYIHNNDRHSEVVILTNGTLTKKIEYPILRKLINLRFQVSIDGPTARTHNEIRGAGAFERTVSGIEYMQRLGFEVNLLSVLSKRSAIWIEDFFKLAKQLKVNSISFVRIVINGQAKELVMKGEDIVLDPEDIKSAYHQIIKYASKYEVNTVTKGPLWCLLHPSLGSYGNFSEAIVIDYQGYLLASSRSRLRIGKVLNEGLKAIFFKYQKIEMKKRKKIPVCSSCSYKNSCGGDRNAAFAANGDFWGPDPGCWLEKQTKIN